MGMRVSESVSSGILELDEILRGGYPRNRLLLIEGEPGTGKTTLALQFLLSGVAQGETALYVTFSESEEEIRQVGDSHGWGMDGLQLLELNSLGEKFKPEEQYTVFHPSEVELSETTQRVIDEVNRIKPTRLVVDSLSEIRLLAREPLRYRRQILALKDTLARCKCTVLFLEDRTAGQDMLLQSIAHGVIVLQREQSEYGGNRRRLQVAKMRGVDFLDGFHDFVIRRGGIRVFPRLVSTRYRAKQIERPGHLSTGSEALDKMIFCGLPWGIGALIVGPPGTGKSSFAASIASSAAAAGHNVSAYLFDELRTTFLERASMIGLPLDRFVQSNRIHVDQVDPAEVSPGEFAYNVLQRVDKEDCRVVIIDSLNGYQNAMPSDRYLIVQMHELLATLNNRGVISILISTQHDIVGATDTSSFELTYLSDLVISLRYFEAAGEVRQAISILKNRKGGQERFLREFSISPKGIQIGKPLFQFRGILTGIPTFEGPPGALFADEAERS
jgi:circadian clock protein KaiC